VKHWLRYVIAVFVVLPIAAVTVLAIRYRPKADREYPATVELEIRRLTNARDSLRTIVYDAALTSDVLDGRPRGDIAIGLPTPFVDTIVRSVIVGWFHDVELRLPRMRVRKAGDVKARLGIFGRRTVGSYSLDISLRGVHGTLQPGPPTLRFGGDEIVLTVPVRVAAGTGVAHIKAEWDSRGMAGPVCGNMSAERDVTGRIRAREYIARGRLKLSSQNGSLLADPDFPALAIRLFIDPAPSAIAALDSVLATRGGLCAMAIGKSRASERIQEVVGRGFTVHIPQRFFRPIHLPVSVETSVPVAQRAVPLVVTPSGIAVTASTVWLAADVALRGSGAARRP
jgi:hypothetical protein